MQDNPFGYRDLLEDYIDLEQSQVFLTGMVPDYFHIWGGLNFPRKFVKFWSTKKSGVNGSSGRNESESVDISKKIPRNSCKFWRGQPPASPP